jgi:hypothetical protein
VTILLLKHISILSFLPKKEFIKRKKENDELKSKKMVHELHANAFTFVMLKFSHCHMCGIS